MKELLFRLSLFALCFGLLNAQAQSNLFFEANGLGSFSGLYTQIMQDSQGVLWLGGNELLKFEAGELVAARGPEGQTFANSYVESLVEHPRGWIWVATRYKGLFLQESSSGRLLQQRYFTQRQINNISGFSVGAQGQAWIGTDRQGLHRLDASALGGSATERLPFSEVLPAPGSPIDLRDWKINCLAQTAPDSLLIGTPDGALWVQILPDGSYRASREAAWQHPDTKSLEKVAALPDGRLALLWDFLNLATALPGKAMTMHRREGVEASFLRPVADNMMLNILVDTAGMLWLNTPEHGILRFDPADSSFLCFAPSGGNCNLGGASALGFAPDGAMLAANSRQWASGQRIPFFQTYSSSGPPGRRVQSASIRSILVAPDSTLWVGGYNSFNQLKGGQIDSLNVGLVYSTDLLAGRLWIGTEGNGLFSLKPDHGRPRRHWPELQHEQDSLDLVYIYKVLATDSQIWVGHLNGLSRFWPEEGRWDFFRHDSLDPGSLQPGDIKALLLDSRGRLWVGSQQAGLSVLMPGQRRFRHFRHQPGDAESLSDDAVFCVFEDSRRNIWVGTGNRLNLFREPDGSFEHISTGEGLPDNLVYGILEDEQGFLWMSTNHGLARLDPRSREVLFFDELDGLQHNEFNTGSFHKGLDGRLYFGGIGGLNAFDPTEAGRFTYTLRARLGQVELQGGQYPDSLGVLELPDDYPGLRVLLLVNETHRPDRVRMAYRLAGPDERWIVLDGCKNWLDLNGLRPGEHRLEVKVANGYGHWSDPSLLLVVRVAPPFWASVGFWLLVLLLLGGLVVALVALRTRSLRQKNSRLEALIRERTREVLLQKEEIESQSKTLHMTNAELLETNDKLEHTMLMNQRLTAMIAHDLKQPLSTLLNHHGDTNILQAGYYMKRLIDNMLDLYKGQTVGLDPQLGQHLLGDVVEAALRQTQVMLSARELTLTREFSPRLMLAVDFQLLTRVLVNFLSNAAKFSPRGKAIVLRGKLRDEQGRVRVEIEDQGPGVAPEAQKKLFRDFERDKVVGYNKLESTGLGLAFNKLAIVAHPDGRIGYLDAKPQGAIFWFEVPSVPNQSQRSLVSSESDEAGRDGLGPADLALLRPFGLRLRTLSVYEYSNVKKILDEIPGEGSPALEEWVAKVFHSLTECREDIFAELVRQTLDQG